MELYPEGMAYDGPSGEGGIAHTYRVAGLPPNEKASVSQRQDGTWQFLRTINGHQHEPQGQYPDERSAMLGIRAERSRQLREALRDHGDLQIGDAHVELEPGDLEPVSGHSDQVAIRVKWLDWATASPAARATSFVLEEAVPVGDWVRTIVGRITDAVAHPPQGQ